MKCTSCEKSELTRKKVEYNQFGIALGKFDALVCPSCGETIFEGSVSEQIEKKAKKLGIWSLARKARIGTSGTSLDVKLPKQIVDFMELKKGQEVIIAPSDKRKIEITIT